MISELRSFLNLIHKFKQYKQYKSIFILIHRIFDTLYIFIELSE